jgi:hypothetical protein
MILLIEFLPRIALPDDSPDSLAMLGLFTRKNTRTSVIQGGCKFPIEGTNLMVRGRQTFTDLWAVVTPQEKEIFEEKAIINKDKPLWAAGNKIDGGGYLVKAIVHFTEPTRRN